MDTLIIINLDDMLLIRRTAKNVQMHCNTVVLILPELGICDKSKEVSDDPLTGDGVSGYGNKFQRNYNLSSIR